MPGSNERIAVRLPDGSEMHVERGATVERVAREIGPGLAADAVAGRVRPLEGGEWELVAPEHPLEGDVELEVVTEDGEAYRRVLRHTAAHVFGQALQRRYPGANLAIGPPTDEGFYYDVAGVDLDEDDLEAIESEMVEIVAADYALERVECPREEALEFYADNPYKREILQQEAAGEETVSFYVQDGWRDLCRGPHVASTGEVGAVKLLSVSAAYWRGEESNDSLTRVYGTAFESEAALESFLERRREAERRDHRRIGREMDLFSVPEHSPGCVHFHPDGMVVRRELAEYVREKNAELGYEEVRTPELNRADLWKATGHYEAFVEAGEMFAWEQDGEEYGLKPMNCANHAHIYGQKRRSYRDLPVRYAEFGTVYRNEQSGELSGTLRVRGLTQDDGHAFVRPDQLEAEVQRTLAVIEDIYDTFDLEVLYKLETRGEDAIGSDEVWETATDALRNALEAAGLDYEVEAGEAAFYGPKIGLDARDALGREWTIGTVQMDFNIPERLDLVYVGEDNEEHRPVVVHRALLGSFERFLAVLVEHYGGNFPLWLAPEQVRVLPVAEHSHDYAGAVADRIEAAGFRVSVDRGDRTVGRKVRAGHDDRVPYMVVVGEDEREADTVSVRDRQERERRGVDPGAFLAHLREERAEKRVSPDFLE